MSTHLLDFCTSFAMMPYLIVDPVVFPIIGASITMIFGNRTLVQRATSLLCLAICSISSFMMLIITYRHGTYAFTVGGWHKKEGSAFPLGITLVVDQLSAVMLLVSCIILTSVLLYAIGQGIRDGRQGEPVSIFQPSYLMLTAGVSNAFMAGDLFNLYVSIEVLLMSSYVLLTIGGSTTRIRAGITYVVVSSVSSIIFLLGIIFIYATTGTLNFADLAVRLTSVSRSTQDSIYAVLLVGFGIKAAVFPLSNWLPDSYPTAPAPITAVFAGLLTKIGAYAIIRVHTLLFPQSPLETVLEIAGLLTMFIGIFGAIAQDDIKRLLSFTLVSHMGYMFFGIALSTEKGLSAAIFYTVHHILVQTTLFLVVGLIERQAGSTSLRRLGGLGTAFPTLTLVLLIPALNLGGIPPFTGFIGKLALIQAGVDEGGTISLLLIAGSIITSLLTLYVVVRVWTLAVWRPREDAPEGNLSSSQANYLLDDTSEVEFADRNVGKMPLLMVVPTATLIFIGIAMAFSAGSLIRITNQAAHQLTVRENYIHAVLSEE